MHKKFRRRRWGIRKQVIKAALIVTFSCCVLFLLAVSFYDECSYLGKFHSRTSELNPNACKIVSGRETLNATFLAGHLVVFDTELDKGDASRIDAVAFGKAPRESSRNRSSLTQRKKKVFTDHGESITEFPIDGGFEERKDDAEKACIDMLNTAMVKQSQTATGDHTTNLKFSTGYTVPPMSTHATDPTFYNKNMLQLIKLRGDVFNKRPKYFQTAGSAKKNRWVYFHRIVKSPEGPSHNKVVEIKWCPIFKAASTPWLAVFTKLSRALTNNTEAQIKRGRMGFMDLARTYRLLTPRIYDPLVHPFKYSMVVVRHPFKRLLSAYRDKIERVKGRLYYYNKYSTRIIARFRSKSKPRPLKSKDRDFSFNVPTFEEFVHYVLSTEPRKLDEHWRPMFLDCNPCHRTFDFILKVESLNEDKDKIMQYLHVSTSDPLYKEVEDVWVRWNNPSGTNQPMRNESYYFSQLGLDDIEKLYNLYEPDFRIFNYSPETYFLMGKDG